MIIEQVVLKNFRNFASLRLCDLSPRINLFYGANGSGKTNILEAIGLASLAKSCRGALDSQMVRFEAPAAGVEIEGVVDGKRINIKFAIAPRGDKKVVGPFGKAIRISDAVGTFAIVFVLPEDIAITSGSPRHHRSFLDIYLAQFDRAYLADLMEYQRVLKQRNTLLKKLKSGEDGGLIGHLTAWDENLVTPALRIMQARARFIAEISPRVAGLSQQLSGSADCVQIAYKPKMHLSSLGDKAAAMGLLAENHDNEIRMGATLWGPHRDVMEIMTNDVSLKNYGSLGQKKTVLLAMKLAARDIVSRHRGEPAILVLDEAFAQLDSGRARALLGLLSDGGQVFLASASAKKYMQDIASKVIEMDQLTPRAD